MIGRRTENKRNNFLMNFLLLVISIIFALALCEVILRLFFIKELDIAPTLKTGSVVYMPNQTSEFRLAGEINTAIKINSRGFRDAEFIIPGKYNRLVVLGDSFVEGWGVNIENTFVKKLEKNLIDKGYPVDHVYNAGHNGTNPKNYIEVYKEYFINDKSVKLIILCFFLGNDVIEERTPGRLKQPEYTISYHIKYYMQKYSALYNYLRREVRYSKSMEWIFSKLGFTTPPMIPWDLHNQPNNIKRWSYTESYIYDFYKNVRRENRNMLVVLIPPVELVDDVYFRKMLEVSRTDEKSIDRFGLKEYLVAQWKNKGIPILDLTDTFRRSAKSPSVKYYFQTDAHWNNEGHELAAKAIFDYLESDKKLLPSASQH